ncbi:universal stress protein [Bradyrhizobium sp. BWA-3-5]|uniref:universal stress protein n=1 Tax=Bradyrhizobium sp. BWA-3-5 TaxID=3080013 RepID=UPI00293E16B9|nr:universal stress protein [Bradyrhizobium sp. BWA-3-5]WOH67799.1 universal stress protein [Bradyrhizobium sp. BWA-3-5]
MRDLLSVLPVGTGGALGHSTDYAIGLAKARGSHLTVLVVADEAIGPAPQERPDTMQGDIVDGLLISACSGLSAQKGEQLAAAAKSSGTECTVLSASSTSPNFRQLLVGTAQVRDVVIFDVEGPLQQPMLGWVEAILFGSGRPIVLAPFGGRPVINGTIVFAWDESRSAVRTLHDILPLMIGSRDVVVVSVIDDKQIRNPGSGDWICSYLARWGVTARFQPISRRSEKVGVDLLDFASRMNADVLAMGGFGHSREREFVFGSATRDILQSNIAIPVFLSH